MAAILLLIAIALPAASYLLLQSHRVQTYVAGLVTRSVSEKLNTTISIGTVEIAFLYRVRLNEVFIEDFRGDTLLYAGSIIAGIRSVNPVSRSVRMGSIDFNNALVNLYIDSTRTANIKHFISQIKKEDAEKGKWKVAFSNMKLNDSRLYLRNYFQKEVPFGINFTDFQLKDINADIKQFTPSPDSLTFRIESLRFTEASGFELEDFSAGFSQSKTFLKFSDPVILSSGSDIRGGQVSMYFDSWKKFRQDSLFRDVIFHIDLADSRVNLNDVSYYAPSLRDTRQTVFLTAQMRGPLNKFKGRNLAIAFGDSSILQGEISLDGLPEAYKTFIYADISSLKTNEKDLNSLVLPGGKTVHMPEQMKSLGTITYKGQFTGFINDFVAFGSFHTDLGGVSTDLLLRPDTLNSVDFDGRLTAEGFEIGRMIDASENVGKISLSANTTGMITSDGSIRAEMNGIIQQVEIRNYNYTNIRLAGDLIDRTFNGSVNISDPNIEFEFLGSVDLTDSLPAYDFTANVDYANLYELNIDRSSPEFTASFNIIANATGQTVNDLNGEITLLNSVFRKQDEELQIHDLNINAINTPGMNQLTLKSDYLDVNITGVYQLDLVKESVHDFFYSYLPSMADPGHVPDTLRRNRFDLDASIKNMQPILDMFLPDYQLAGSSTLTCGYYPEEQNFSLHFQSPMFRYKSITWDNFSILFSSNSGNLSMEAGGSGLMLGNQISLDNFTVFSDAGRDSLNFEARWNSWQDILDRGNFKGMASISRHSANAAPHLEIFISPTTFYANDSLWQISRGKIMVDSSDIRFDNISVTHNEQSFSLAGMISKDTEKTVELLFDRFNLANLNGITTNRGHELAGILNGNASFSGLYEQPLFVSRLTIDSLRVNKEMLGNSEINSTWDDASHSILIDAFAMRDNLRTIEITGGYELGGEEKLDFELHMDKFRLSLFNPYVESVFNDLSGIATGSLSLTGTTGQPLLNGEMNLQKTAFGINYLNTRYSFTDMVRVVDNNILFQNIQAFDSRANSAMVSGSIRTSYLKNPQLDLTIRSDKFLCLNTTQSGNSTFYGTAYAQDLLMTINGPPKNITIDISASTAENTVINIPLSEGRELNEYEFISVYRLDTFEKAEQVIQDYKVDLSGLQLNLELEVTPEAEVQIIFDPKLGDIIRGQGNGNLDIMINTNGDFVMFGEYVISEGDYLFTLQNFINKRFTIEEGGTIRWNGDPLDATIDIVAYYRTKASLSDLLGETTSQTEVVDDRLTMTGKLMSPDVKYDIYLPNASEDDRMKVNSAIASSEELIKQFISLLVQNRFVLSSIRTGQASGGSSASPYANVAGVNASEFLLNQLSNWLSQISNDVDIGINYRTNQELRSDEVQVALKTQLFNDRLTVNGSVDVATNGTTNAVNNESENIVGEFDIDYKLTRNGKLRIKTYNHASNDILTDGTTYTQGFGIFYKEEFNNLRELWQRYSQRLLGLKAEQPVIISED